MTHDGGIMSRRLRGALLGGSVLTVGTALAGLALSGTASATGNPEQTLECGVIGVDYRRGLVNGDHINMEIQRINGTKFQVNAYVDRNIAGGYDTLGLRINGFDPIPLTKEQVESGNIVWRYGEYLNGMIQYRVTFVQTNSTDTWPDKDCPEVPPTEEPEPTTPTATVTVPGETVTLPGETVTLPGETETVTVPGETTTLPGETTTVPGDTQTVVSTQPGDDRTVYVTETTPVTDVPTYVNSGALGSDDSNDGMWIMGMALAVGMTGAAAVYGANRPRKSASGPNGGTGA